MKTLALICFMLLFNLSTSAQQYITPADASDCSQKFFQALENEDASSLRSLLTNDFTILSFDGQLIDGITLMDAMSKGGLVVESGQVSGANTRVYGDAGIVTGTWRASGTIQSIRYSNDVAFMLVCVRQGGGWKVASVQFTPLP